MYHVYQHQQAAKCRALDPELGSGRGARSTRSRSSSRKEDSRRPVNRARLPRHPLGGDRASQATRGGEYVGFVTLVILIPSSWWWVVQGRGGEEFWKHGWSRWTEGEGERARVWDNGIYVVGSDRPNQPPGRPPAQQCPAPRCQRAEDAIHHT